MRDESRLGGRPAAACSVRCGRRIAPSRALGNGTTADSRPRLDFAPLRCILVSVRTTIDLDPDTERELAQTVSLTRERQAVVLRQAIRAGLPLVQSRWQAPRPEGYFTDDYPLPPDRLELEAAMGRVKQRPER